MYEHGCIGTGHPSGWWHIVIDGSHYLRHAIEINAHKIQLKND